jgi:hypothetical protein
MFATGNIIKFSTKLQSKTPTDCYLTPDNYQASSIEPPSHTNRRDMAESLAAFREGRSKDLRQLAEEHLQHEYAH